MNLAENLGLAVCRDIALHKLHATADVIDVAFASCDSVILEPGVNEPAALSKTQALVSASVDRDCHVQLTFTCCRKSAFNSARNLSAGMFFQKKSGKMAQTSQTKPRNHGSRGRVHAFSIVRNAPL